MLPSVHQPLLIIVLFSGTAKWCQHHGFLFFPSQELSEYEKLAHKMKITQKGASWRHICDSGFNMFVPEATDVTIVLHFHADLEQNGFCKNPFFHAIIAEVPEHLKTKEGERETPTNVFQERASSGLFDLWHHCFDHVPIMIQWRLVWDCSLSGANSFSLVLSCRLIKSAPADSVLMSSVTVSSVQNWQLHSRPALT